MTHMHTPECPDCAVPIGEGHCDECRYQSEIEQLPGEEWEEYRRQVIQGIRWITDERNSRARSRTIADEAIEDAAVCAAGGPDGEPVWLSGGSVAHAYPGRAQADYAAVLLLDGEIYAWATRADACRGPYGRRLPGPEAVGRRCLPRLTDEATGETLYPPWRRGQRQSEIDRYLRALKKHLETR